MSETKKVNIEQKREKPVNSNVSSKNLFVRGNLLEISEDLKKELKDQGLEYRFISAAKYAKSGNIHINKWVVYHRKADKISNEMKAFGLPSDGTIRRDDLVLAVRPIEVGNGHRAWLQEKVERQSSSVKAAASDLKRMAKQGGMITDVKNESDF